jgi:hypothetical protein
MMKYSEIHNEAVAVTISGKMAKHIKLSWADKWLIKSLYKRLDNNGKPAPVLNEIFEIAFPGYALRKVRSDKGKSKKEKT